MQQEFTCKQIEWVYIMTKLIIDVFSHALLILSLILSLVIAGDIPTANAEEPLTVEGEWKITSSNAPHAHDVSGYIIARQGDGYNVIAQTGGKKYSGPGGTGLYYGSSTEIKATSTPFFDELVEMFKGQNVPAAAIRELAGKVATRHIFTLSADGRFLEQAQDGVMIYFYNETGRLAKYEIKPYYFRATLVRVSGPTQGEKRSAMAQVESRGEFYVVTTDGRTLKGKDAEQIPLEEGTKVITGSSGHVRMKLPDDTTFTIGPDSDIVIDSFVYDPDNTPKKVIASMSKGVFRWVTGKTKPHKDLAEMKVKLPVMAVGIRGTDFEVTVNPDGNGFVILYFGQLEITEKKTGFKFILDAGYKVTFGTDGFISRPIKFE